MASAGTFRIDGTTGCELIFIPAGRGLPGPVTCAISPEQPAIGC